MTRLHYPDCSECYWFRQKCGLSTLRTDSHGECFRFKTMTQAAQYCDRQGIRNYTAIRDKDDAVKLIVSEE